MERKRYFILQNHYTHRLFLLPTTIANSGNKVECMNQAHFFIFKSLKSRDTVTGTNNIQEWNELMVESFALLNEGTQLCLRFPTSYFSRSNFTRNLFTFKFVQVRNCVTEQTTHPYREILSQLKCKAKEYVSSKIYELVFALNYLFKR